MTIFKVILTQFQKKKTEKEKVHNSDTQPTKVLYSSVFECAIQDLFSCVYKSVSHIQINAAVFIPESRVPDVYIQNSRAPYYITIFHYIFLTLRILHHRALWNMPHYFQHLPKQYNLKS